MVPGFWFRDELYLCVYIKWIHFLKLKSLKTWFWQHEYELNSCDMQYCLRWGLVSFLIRQRELIWLDYKKDRFSIFSTKILKRYCHTNTVPSSFMSRSFSLCILSKGLTSLLSRKIFRILSFCLFKVLLSFLSFLIYYFVFSKIWIDLLQAYSYLYHLNLKIPMSSSSNCTSFLGWLLYFFLTAYTCY